MVRNHGLGLPPFPEGWYFVASRRSIVKARLLQRQWMGQDIVAWCDSQGHTCVAESVCPHLGSDLGPSVGGRVRNGNLICPFHGFEFDGTGQCVSTPFAPAPKSANLKMFETREVQGMVFAWWGIGGRPPQWQLPRSPEVSREWSPLRFMTLRFRGHPQDTTENAVDLAHLRCVHGYGNIIQVAPLTVDGPHLKSSLGFRRTITLAGIRVAHLDVSAVVQVVGLGFSLVEAHLGSSQMVLRYWVLATPVDGTQIDLVLASQLRADGALAPLRLLPRSLISIVAGRIVKNLTTHDVLQDVVIWERKRFLPRPCLCRSDGEIGAYRRYCRQFYEEVAGSGVKSSEAPSRPLHAAGNDK